MSKLVASSLETTENRLYDITDEVVAAVLESAVTDGIVLVSTQHTTASIGIVSFPDPLTFEDVMDDIERLIPTRVDFKHQHDTPSDAAGHIKSALVGSSVTLPIADGEIVFGHSQHIYFFEFDGPRSREFNVKVISG